MKFKTSSFVTLPSFPVAGILLISKLCCFIKPLTAGVANAFADESDYAFSIY